MDKEDEVNEYLRNSGERDWFWSFSLRMRPGSGRQDARSALRDWLYYMEKELRGGSIPCAYFILEDGTERTYLVAFLETLGPDFSERTWLWYWSHLNRGGAFRREIRPGPLTGLFIHLFWKARADFGISAGWQDTYFCRRDFD